MGTPATPLDCVSETLQESSSLTKFQTRLLETLCDGPKHGLGIAETLDPLFEEEVHHGRIYPNLDDLADEGYIAKEPIDRRTNEYRLTDAGRALLAADYNRLASCLEEEVEGQ